MCERPCSASAQVQRLDVVGADLAAGPPRPVVEVPGHARGPAGEELRDVVGVVERRRARATSTAWPSDSSRRAGALGRRHAVGVHLDLSAGRRGEQADAQPAGVGAHLVGVGRARRRARRRGRPAPGPCTASRIAAVSRTERVTASSPTSPPMMSPNVGARDDAPARRLEPDQPARRWRGCGSSRRRRWRARPRTMPAATAAAEPPLEPPGDRPGPTGCWWRRRRAGSVVGRIPSSGVFVLPEEDEARAAEAPRRASCPSRLDPARRRAGSRMPL